jgi:hypothetical protein
MNRLRLIFTENRFEAQTALHEQWRVNLNRGECFRMPRKLRLGEIFIRGISLKEWGVNLIICVLAAFFSSLMVIINHLNLPGEIHQVKIELDQYIPFVLPFVLGYLIYYPFVYGGWALIFFFSPRMFAHTLSR